MHSILCRVHLKRLLWENVQLYKEDLEKKKIQIYVTQKPLYEINFFSYPLFWLLIAKVNLYIFLFFNKKIFFKNCVYIHVKYFKQKMLSKQSFFNIYLNSFFLLKIFRKSFNIIINLCLSLIRFNKKIFLLNSNYIFIA